MQTRREFLATMFVTLPLVAGSVPALAGKVNAGGNGVAISGYDPVAYFRQNAATKGNADYSASHDGATYHFASVENRDTFAADPEKFAPQYGGFCAYAVANGYTAKIDPEAFSVVEGRLFLNYSKGVRSRWLQDTAGYITKGDANWPALSAN